MIDENKYLGVLCKRGHEHENTGKSLRLRSTGDCILCAKLRNNRKYRDKKTTSVSMKKKRTRARVFATKFCCNYDDCLTAISRAGNGNLEMPCFGCALMEIKNF